MRVRFPALAAAALALAGLPTAWGNVSAGEPSEQGANAEASSPPPPPAPVKKDTAGSGAGAAPVDEDETAESNHYRYCNQGHEGLTNPCKGDLSDYCCDFRCTHCGPAIYCRTESPFLRDSGVCNPNHVGGICANYYQLCPAGGTGYRYPTGYPVAETSACIYLGNNCWRSRYADSHSYYGNGDQCTMWPPSPRPARITVYRFNTELGWDELFVDGVAFSGTYGPNGRLAHNSLTWSTDGSITRSGWHICLAPQFTGHPTGYPTEFPTSSPTGFPAVQAPPPTASPASPTVAPAAPSAAPSAAPTDAPAAAPTAPPSGAPSHAPAGSPSGAPVHQPTVTPTVAPTATAVVLEPSSDCLDLGGGCFRTILTRRDTYRNNARCNWAVRHAARIVVREYDVEMGNDHFVIDGVPFTDRSGPNGIVVYSSLRWRSDGSVRAGGWHVCLEAAGGATRAPSRSPTGYPSGYPTRRTAPPNRTGFPSTMFPIKSGFPTTAYPISTHFPTPAGVPTDGPVQISSCTAGAAQYTVDGVERDSPCNLHGDSRHVDYVADYNGVARLYACSRAGRHHFALCTCSGAACADGEQPANCFVPANFSMGCVGTLRGAAFSADGTKAFFACNKEVRVCRVDLSRRDGQLYHGCQVVEGAGCPRWAAIRGLAIRPRPNRGDLLVVACTDRKTRACSLDADNMRMQEGRMCVKGGREKLCQSIGKPSGLAFSADNRLIAQCDRGYSYCRFVGGIVQDIVHTPYNGSAPCPTETNAVAVAGPGRAAVACGPDGVRECLIRYL